MTNIDLDTLERVIGGAGQQYFENVRDRDGRIVNSPAEVREATKSTSQRVIESTDRAMAPWKLFNGIFGGARGQRPTIPPPPRPSYQ